MDWGIKGRMVEGMKHMVLPGMIALSLLLAACSKEERARATRNADPEITNVDTNEIANVDYRKRMKDRRENMPEDLRWMRSLKYYLQATGLLRHRHAGVKRGGSMSGSTRPGRS